MNYKKFRAQQKSLTSEDGVIKYVDKGEGDVILLLHGVPTSSWLYRKIIRVFVEKGFRVIAPDMLGFGNSGNPKGYDIYSPEQHAKRLSALMEHLQIESWTHVFHDAGGLWTWELFKINPTKINRLVVLNTIIFEQGFKPPLRMSKNIFTEFTMWLYRNRITTNLLIKQLFNLGLVHNHLSKKELEGYKIPILDGKTRAMFHFFSRTCNELPDYSNVIKNIKIPSMVIWGKHDTMLEWKPQEQLVKEALNISDENIHLIDAKHFIQEEQPEEISQLILGFLAKNE